MNRNQMPIESNPPLKGRCYAPRWICQLVPILLLRLCHLNLIITKSIDQEAEISKLHFQPQTSFQKYIQSPLPTKQQGDLKKSSHSPNIL